uniref:Uncharacterized protein n=1 Tax=Timema shepardi TaxID=629360 RepID=A0A7R9B128_TIMSH|nr:unnamed protein product [Timema shepardi]
MGQLRAGGRQNCSQFADKLHTGPTDEFNDSDDSVKNEVQLYDTSQGRMETIPFGVNTENTSKQGFGTLMAPSRVDDVIPKPLDKRIGGTGKSLVEGLRQLPEVVLDGRHIKVTMQTFRTYQGVSTIILRHLLWNSCILLIYVSTGWSQARHI